MNSKFILIFLFLLCISFVSSVTLSMSPPQIDFVGGTNELICKKVEVKVEGVENLVGKTKWAAKGFDERNLLKHNIKGEDLKLEIDFPVDVKIDRVKKIDICIEGKNVGDYHGVLLYKIVGKPVQVGIWLNVSIDKKEGGVLSLTGKVIDSTEGNVDDILIWIVVLLLIVLGILSWKKGRRKP